MNNRGLFSILMGILIPERTLCFTYYVSKKELSRSGWVSSASILTSLKATIYYPSDDNGAGHNIFHFDESETNKDTEQHRDLTDVLKFPEDRQDTLARLAVAYAPADQGLTLDKIDHVEVLRIDGSKIVVSVVVCDQHKCVTVAVPVEFPNPCCPKSCDHELTTCVIDNVAVLDIKADEVLRETGSSIAKDEYAELSRHELLPGNGVDGVNLPFWWTDPGPDSDMADECDSTRRLLNAEEHRSEVVVLAQMSLVKQRRYCQNYEVIDAGVVRVGPAGLYLRTLLRKLNALHEGDESRIMDVAIPFDNKATHSNQLKSSVLEAVSAVSKHYDVRP